MSIHYKLANWGLSLALCLAIGMLTACGGGGGSSSGGANGGAGGRSVSGQVVDPGIAGALVKLVNAQGKALAVPVRSDLKGTFTFQVANGANLEGARVIAVGGQDSQTGQDFSGLTLAGAVSGGEGLATPLTTLVLWLEDEGQSHEQARETVAGWLGLSADQVVMDPLADPAVQQASLLVSLLGVSLNQESAPMERLAETLSAHGDLDSTRLALEADASLSEATRSRVALIANEFEELQALVPNEGAAEIVAAANLIAVRHGITAYLETVIGQPSDDATSQANIDALSRALITANNGKGVPASSHQIRNLLRYVFQAYDINAAELAQAGFAVPQALISDPDIAQIASLRAIDHRIPLTEAERLGMDNDARREYFYASDLSPFYRADRLFDDVLDDLILDPVNTEIARGLVFAGRYEQAKTVLRTRIFQPHERAKAMHSMAKELIELGNYQQAREMADAGVAVMDESVDAKGVENLSADDAARYSSLVGDYLALGEPEAADAALSKVLAFMEIYAGQPYSTTYGRLLTAMRKNADAQVEAALDENSSESDRIAAMQSVDLYTRFVNGAGYQTTGDCGPHYKLGTFYLVGSAEFYHALKADEKVADIIDQFENKRAISECNRDQTEVYLKYMAPFYVATGQIDRYYEQLESTVFDPKYVADANESMVIGDAYQKVMEGDLEAALAIVREAFPDSKDYLAQLTEETGSIERLAESLYSVGHLEQGNLVRDAAWSFYLSDAYQQEYTNDAGALLDDGCLKLVGFADSWGDSDQARAWMPECMAIANDVLLEEMDPAVRFKILSSVTQQYTQLELIDKAKETFARAQSEAEQIADEESISLLSEQMRLAIGIGDWKGAMELGEVSRDAYFRIAATASDDDSRKEAMGAAEMLSDQLLELARALGIMASDAGYLESLQQQTREHSRDMVKEMVVGGVGGPGMVGLADMQLSESSRLTYLREAAKLLADARYYEEAENIVAMDRLSDNDRNKMLQDIAFSMTTATDFGVGSLAVQDSDGDGRPDFFNLNASEQDIADSALTLDDDMDGDGIADDMDATPFCASCDG